MFVLFPLHRSCKGNEVLILFQWIVIVPILWLWVLLEVLVHVIFEVKTDSIASDAITIKYGKVATHCIARIKLLCSTATLPTLIRGSSPRWLYPDSWGSRAKSPPSLLLRAIRPRAAHPGDCYGTPGNEAIYCP